MDKAVYEAFQKVKEDMQKITTKINTLSEVFSSVHASLSLVATTLKEFKQEFGVLYQELESQRLFLEQTRKQQTSTEEVWYPTQNKVFKPLKGKILPISTGNQGVTTDRQTDQQTDRQEENAPRTDEKEPFLVPSSDPIKGAAMMLESLDSLKKEVRLKFKRLTEKEMLVFSTLYQLDEEQGYADYSALAARLNLTQSSIRDYIGRLMEKGIPIEKRKIKNKSVQLNIAKDLKKIASLQTLLYLRDL